MELLFAKKSLQLIFSGLRRGLNSFFLKYWKLIKNKATYEQCCRGVVPLKIEYTGKTLILLISTPREAKS